MNKELKKAVSVPLHQPIQGAHFQGFAEEGGHTGEPRKPNKMQWVPTENVALLNELREIKEILLRIELLLKMKS